MTSRHKKRIMFGVFFVLLGAIVVIAVRFALYKSDEVHYHANFALYVDGKRDTFNNFTYYEEVQACVDHSVDNPKSKVHMHDRNSGLVHVHESGMTWGYFFANLGYTLGTGVIKTESGVYVDGQGKKLSFILNGEEVSSVAGKVIKSEDRLLINYGDQDKKALAGFYDTVPKDAPKANTEHDPSTCIGGHELTFWQRLKEAVL